MITFIVPAHNEESFIGSTLDSLHRAARGIAATYELIVVDDSSTDATAEIASAHGARVLTRNHRQIAATRNSGSREATGTLLIFVDADTIVTESILRRTIEAIATGAVGGAAQVAFDGDLPLFGNVLTWLWRCVQPAVRLGTGCFFFCSASAFAQAGGFDETLYAFEDFALSRRLKHIGQFVIISEAVVTSGRNVRAHSAIDALRMLAGVTCHGTAFFRKRDGLRFWYRDRSSKPAP